MMEDLDKALQMRNDILKGEKYACLNNYLVCLKSINNVNKQYMLWSELAFFELKYPELMYNEYFVERKQLLKGICDKLKVNTLFDVKKKRQNNKSIILVAYKVLDQMYSVGEVVINLANAFCELEYNVEIIIENPNYSNLLENLPQYMQLNSEDFKNHYIGKLDERVKVFCGNSINLSENINHIFEHLKYSSPDFVLDCTDEHSLLSYYLEKHFFTYNLPMRTSNGSSLFFDKILCADVEQMKRVNLKYKCYAIGSFAKFLPNMCVYPEPLVKYDKSEKFGKCNEDSFVIVTVGSRLDRELSEQLISSVCSLIENNEMIWVVVGGHIPESISNEYCDLIKRKKILEYGLESDLPALYQICDVYLNPERKGGGISIAWAMRQGLPIVMKSCESDGMAWIGKENTIDGTEKDLTDYIYRLYTDKLLYKNTSLIMKNRSYENTIERCINSIISVHNEYMDSAMI